MMDNVLMRAERRARARQTMAAMRRDRLRQMMRRVKPASWVWRDTIKAAEDASKAFDMLREALRAVGGI